MPKRSDYVTSSRFDRRLLPGRHDLVLKVAFGSDAKAAKALHVTRTTVWRWRHDRVPLPKWVADALSPLLQKKVVEAHEAQTELGYFLSEPPKPARPLSGCCAGLNRRIKKIPTTPEE